MTTNLQTQSEDQVLSNKPEKRNKFLVAGIIGNILEWFDYGIYGFFAVAISANFFPANDPMVSLILSFMVFGLGFVARPIGGFLFGYFGDKIGRKNTLSITVILMGISTFIMGILPTYAQIGLAAPIILTICRLLQGISAGGEWGSAVSFLGEYAKPNNRAFIVSFSQVGSAAGLLLGSLLGLLISNILSAEAINDWAWRIAFLLGIVIAIFGYFFRRGVDETPVFKETKESNDINNPLKEAFKNHKIGMITCFLLISGAFVTYWLILSFMPTYISEFLKLPINAGFSLTALTLVSYMISLPIAGYFADKFGRRPLMLLGSGGIVLFSYPLFSILANTDSYFVMAIVVCLEAMIFAMFQAPNTVAMSELFPAKVRVSGFSVPYQLGSAVFAGTTMMIATWLISITGNVLMVPIYMCLTMCLSLLATIFLYKETKDKPYDQ
ncbi:MFS transporter [Ureibacillus sp. FSL W8-0352]|uniref:MFS transporter n=1 Tax=Ureibacillus sp. FSL W8-0352 TaxID=2954596 RepID=UPI0030FC1423